jgi:hypothetical protein
MSKIVYGAYGVNGWVSAPPHKHIHVGSPHTGQKTTSSDALLDGGSEDALRASQHRVSKRPHNESLSEKQALSCSHLLPCAPAWQRKLYHARPGKCMENNRRTIKARLNTRQRGPHGKGSTKRTTKKDRTAVAETSARQRITTRQWFWEFPCLSFCRAHG